MRVVRFGRDLGFWCERYRAAGLSVGFVPTMGALHSGHLSLLRRAREECDRVVASIFVNPTQFGPREDLGSYPVTTEADLAACRSEGVDLVLLGAAADMYPEGFQTWVTVEDLTRPLCGADRPGHFRGVATVVAQLLHLAKPHRAYFGLKDYQQSLVVRRMVRDLHIDCDIRSCETVREPDGLAMSSRNARLDPESRRAAPRIHEALELVRGLVQKGEDRVDVLRTTLRDALERTAGIEVSYAEILDAATLERIPRGRLGGAEGPGAVAAVAARIGGVRLIDNVLLRPDGA